MIAFAAYPTIAFIRGPLRRWQRRRKGLGLKCTYDLMAGTFEGGDFNVIEPGTVLIGWGR